MTHFLRLLPLLFCLPLAAHAQTTSFAFPLGCTLGIDCSVLTYQDTNEQPGDLEDPWCGKRTKDDQLGTVFAIPNMTAVDKGVDVLAIDDGQIENVEMRWPDQPGKGCGNGVIIRHKGGWVSRYCGLRQASTILNKGDYVKKGQRIGLAGLTGGRLPWPGLFFTLDRYDRPYDLWTGNAVTAGCRKHAPLIAGLTYQPLSLVQSGITSPAAPLPHKLMKGIPMPPSLKPTDPIVIWAQVEGLAQGDQVRFSFSQNGKLLWQDGGPVNPASPLVYAKQLPPKTGWVRGTILAKVEIIRDRKIVISTTQAMKIN